MRTTIPKLATAVAAIALWAGASMPANAALTLADNGVGYIVPTVIPPSGLGVTYLNNMIDVYNGTAVSPIDGENYTVLKGTFTPPPALATASSLGSDITPSSGDGKGSPTATIHLGTGGFSYLIAQWDGPNGADAVYYIAGLTGDITLSNDLPGFDKNGQPLSRYGLSGYWLGHSTSDTPVPEPTTMIAGALLLLPLGAGAVRILRKRA